MRIDIILAERSRVRADLVLLEKWMPAVKAKAAREALMPDGTEKLLTECLAEHRRLTERLSFIDGTIQQLQRRKTG